jgi:hypothetical protein
MNRRLSLLAIGLLLLTQSNSFAQSQDLPKFEVAGEFSSLARDSFENRTEPGVGARFTFNLNRSVAFEAAGYFYPDKCFSCRNPGNMSEFVAGAKVGKRFEKWGIFGKARPGVVSFSRGEFNAIPASSFGNFPFDIETNRITSFAADLGGVLEFYPTKKIVTRFDAGDTIIHFGRRTINGVAFNPFTQEVTFIPIVQPARTTHNFQFTAGVGFRF